MGQFRELFRDALRSSEAWGGSEDALGGSEGICWAVRSEESCGLVSKKNQKEHPPICPNKKIGHPRGSGPKEFRRPLLLGSIAGVGGWGRDVQGTPGKQAHMLRGAPVLGSASDSAQTLKLPIKKKREFTP